MKYNIVNDVIIISSFFFFFRLADPFSRKFLNRGIKKHRGYSKIQINRQNFPFLGDKNVE